MKRKVSAMIRYAKATSSHVSTAQTMETDHMCHVLCVDEGSFPSELNVEMQETKCSYPTDEIVAPRQQTLVTRVPKVGGQISRAETTAPMMKHDMQEQMRARAALALLFSK